MYNPDQVNALCAGLVGDTKTLTESTEAFRTRMDAIRNDGMLSEPGKATKLKPIEDEAAQIVDPLRKGIAEREAILAREEAAWANPVAVMLAYQPPVAANVLETETDRRMKALERRMETMAFAQQVAIAIPEMRQLLLENAVDAGRWDLVGLALSTRTSEDVKRGFRGLSEDEIRAKFPAWREGRARLAMARAAVETMRLRVAETETGFTPSRRLAQGHRIAQARTDAGLDPEPDGTDRTEGLRRQVDQRNHR